MRIPLLTYLALDLKFVLVMTDKTKNIALGLGFLFTLVICYHFAIVKTLDLKKDYMILKQQEALMENTPRQIALLNQKQKFYDSILNRYQLKGQSIQNSLFHTINIYADSNDLKVISFEEPHVISLNASKLTTYEFTLEGGFLPILQLIHNLEKSSRFGEIKNLRFERKKNFRNGKQYLLAHILLEHF